MPNFFYNTLSLEWHEYEIEGWITMIRLNRNGKCTTNEKECTRRRNPAVPNGQPLGLTVYSTWNITTKESRFNAYVFQPE